MQDLAQDDDRVPEIAIVDERKGRENLLQHGDRVAAIEQRGVRRETEPVVEAPDKVQAEAMEGPDPHLRPHPRRRALARRSDNSPAVRLEKVSTSMDGVSTPSAIRVSIRRTRVRVLPVPGPARSRYGEPR